MNSVVPTNNTTATTTGITAGLLVDESLLLFGGPEEPLPPCVLGCPDCSVSSPRAILEVTGEVSIPLRLCSYYNASEFLLVLKSIKEATDR